MTVSRLNKIQMSGLFHPGAGGENQTVWRIIIFFMISKFILQSVVINLAEWSVRLQWLGERHSLEPLRK
jgi:hypothetical protein